MSQNVAVEPKKIQIANRQKMVTELYLKNMTVTKISETVGVDRKTIQRDLRRVRMDFSKVVPSEEAYKLLRDLLYDHSIITCKAMERFTQRYDSKLALKYAPVALKLWESKARLLTKIGVFDSIPVLDENHPLLKETKPYQLVLEIPKEQSNK